LPSKAKLKQYQQLHSKKFRQKYGLFVVEGLKSVNELNQSEWPVECILCTKSFLEDYEASINYPIEVIEKEDFYKISNQKNPQEVLAIASISFPPTPPSKWKIALDNINDPGNLGTIIRIADWYGITEIYCSQNSVDIFNSKVIQASMGSFLRVRVNHCNLSEQLKGEKVYATLLNGESIREINVPSEGVLLVGNEANGISEELLQVLKPTAVTIPRIGDAESLNAAIATAVCCERLFG
jgi:TrmH family RNA methyltransferase